MADERFFTNKGPFTLKQLATLIDGCQIEAADEDRLVHDVSALDAADQTMLSFLTNIKYTDQLRQSGAGVCVLQAEHKGAAPDGMDLLIVEDAHYAYALIAQAFYPEEEDVSSEPIASSATLGTNVTVSQGAVIADNVIIGDNVFIGRNSVIGRGVVIGNDVVIKDNVTITHSLIGNHVRIFPGTSIGQDGFGFATYQGKHVSIPQIGRVIIGDYVEIGSNVAIDRGAGPDTVIGDGCRLDNLVQIAHNVKLGKGCVLAGQSGVAGSSVLEDYVVLGGQVGVAGHLRVGRGTQVAGQGGVIQDVPPGQVLGGTPTVPIKQWHKQGILLARMATGKYKKND